MPPKKGRGGKAAAAAKGKGKAAAAAAAEEDSQQQQQQEEPIVVVSDDDEKETTTAAESKVDSTPAKKGRGAAANKRRSSTGGGEEEEEAAAAPPASAKKSTPARGRGKRGSAVADDDNKEAEKEAEKEEEEVEPKGSAKKGRKSASTPSSAQKKKGRGSTSEDVVVVLDDDEEEEEAAADEGKKKKKGGSSNKKEEAKEAAAAAEAEDDDVVIVNESEEKKEEVEEKKQEEKKKSTSGKGKKKDEQEKPKEKEKEEEKQVEAMDTSADDDKPAAQQQQQPTASTPSKTVMLSAPTPTSQKKPESGLLPTPGTAAAAQQQQQQNTPKQQPQQQQQPRKDGKGGGDKPHQQKSGNKRQFPAGKDSGAEANGEHAGKAARAAATGNRRTLTKEEIEADHLTALARQTWGRAGESQEDAKKKVVFNAKVVEDIFEKELAPEFPLARIVLLDYSSYLERYLWPFFDAETSSRNHLLSILLMVNQKFRENIAPWDTFATRPEVFPTFFSRVIKLQLDQLNSSSSSDASLSIKEKSVLLIFFINCFQSLETEFVRNQCLRLVSLPLWTNLDEGKVELELCLAPQLQKHWKSLQRKQKAAEKKGESLATPERIFIPGLLRHFFQVLEGITSSPPPMDAVRYCERFLEFVIDLLAQLPTRRFFLALVTGSHFVVRCQMAPLTQMSKGRLFNQLLELLRFHVRFEIDEHTGAALTADDMTSRHYNRINLLQRLAFKYYPEQLRSLSLSNVGAIETRQGLAPHLARLDEDQLFHLACRLRLFSPTPPPASAVSLAPPYIGDKPDRRVVEEVILSYHERRLSQLDAINALPLYPNENLLWDENLVPTQSYQGETCLALPKLNLQYLTFHDYLLRNFNLFRLESTYEIKEDINDQVKRVNARLDDEGRTVFTGWARMILPVQTFSILEIAKPNVGESKPARVVSDVGFNVGLLRDYGLRTEWDSLREHDVIFLVTVQAHAEIGADLPDPDSMHPREFLGIKYVRGAEVVGMLDENGKLINEGEALAAARGNGGEMPKLAPSGARKLRVLLDANQYQLDMAQMHATGSKENPYETFNLVMRRKPQENNFKSVLDCIRSLMNAPLVAPAWLHDILLGYGDPGQGHYSVQPDRLKTVDFVDTFLDAAHCKEALGNNIVFSSASGETVSEDKSLPPFRVHYPETEGEPVRVESYRRPDPGPYPEDVPKCNAVRFTPVQVEGIKAGTNPGLTMLVGPPGTGKTDVAVQIISNLYHNFPSQRILLVTHSNQALNDLFEKIMVLDIHERHMLRLGRGEEQLQTERDYSKFGRVQYMLEKRIELLNEVYRLALSLGHREDSAEFTCETAAHFYLFQVLSRWEEYVDRAKKIGSVEAVKNLFPFATFFANAPNVVFKGESFEEDMRAAEGCFRHIQNVFKFLEECRAFEILRNYQERANYLVTTQARIIAMTCTHAAMKRDEFIRLGFEYDSLVMEEAAQILEIETFIPIMLQQQEKTPRLKRVVLIGDHNQLPPVIQNQAFQQYSHMDQSLFARFVRLGVPTVDLNQQGRARSSIAKLYNWRYKQLGDMPHVLNQTRYLSANAGLAFDYQFIDVDEAEESTPTAYFYQNVVEAEYVVALYVYMRLLGYPANKISILTTYNGQAALLRDIVKFKCANHPLLGSPADIETVDKFQGQQNDYIILSLVRTKTVGHFRDLRRLVVAMSRARLGLYVFGKKSLFENCYELRNTFSKLLARPVSLQVVQGEVHPTSRRVDDHGQMFEVRDSDHLVSINRFLLSQYNAQDIAQYQQQQQQPAEDQEMRDA